jgi:hypothetical protein
MNNLVPTLVLTLPTVRLCLIFIIVLLFVRLCIIRSPLLPLPPGPFGIPFLGFLPFLGQDFHFTLTNLSKRFGPMYQIFLGSKRIVVINDSQIIREAFRLPVFSGRPDTELTKILQGYGEFYILSLFSCQQFFTISKLVLNIIYKYFESQ